ncbi:MAG: hypothetical protein CSA45_05515 [Gammaproteobacteria bacterium]|nr:MAG: hypothetical protein CSA45_05515 [Gammaproteobacteria bacterium]
MKRVLITSFYRPKNGGFCKRYFRALNALLQAGYDIHYLATEPFPIEGEGCHFHHFPWKKEKCETLLFWFVFHLLSPFYLLYIAIRWKADILLAFVPNYGFLLQPSRIFLKKPLILFLRGDTIKAHKINQKSRLIIFIDFCIEALGIFNAEIYGVSETCMNRVLSRHPKIPIKSKQVLRNDIPVSTPASSAKKTDNYLHCSFIGILGKGKNILFLLHILFLLKNERIILHIFGEGEDRQRIENKIKDYCITDKIVLHGWTDYENLWPGIDLVLFPSLHEGAPNTLLEAISNNKAVLASDIPEHREILSEKLLLPFKEETWIKEIRSFLIDKETAKRENRKITEKTRIMLSFNWDKSVCDIFDSYFP